MRPLLLYAAGVAILTLLKVGESSWGGAFAASLLACFVFYFGIWYWRDALRTYADVRLVRRAIREDAPEDGRRAAVIGTLEPQGDLLRAPFSGRDCVAYWYEVFRFSRAELGMIRQLFWGLGIAPSAVHTPATPVKLLGYFEYRDWEELVDDDSFRNAEAYIASTRFTPTDWRGRTVDWQGAGARPAIGAALALHAAQGNADSFRQDYQDLEETHPAPALRRLRLHEHVLPPGTVVCAFGLYSDAQRGLLADPGSTKGRIDLMLAEPKEVLRRLDSKATWDVLLSLFWGMLGLAIAIAF